MSVGLVGVMEETAPAAKWLQLTSFVVGLGNKLIEIEFSIKKASTPAQRIAVVDNAVLSFTVDLGCNHPTYETAVELLHFDL